MTTAIVMIVVCMVLAVVPLWRGASAESRRSARRETNIDAYHQRIRELDSEVAAGRIDAAAAADEKQALGARLVADVEGAGIDADGDVANDVATAPRRPWLASATAIALVGVAGTLGYYWLGDYHAIEQAQMPNIDELVQELAAQVEAQPDDRGARLMLAQAYEARGAYDAAARQLAFINARAVPPVAELLVAEAQARLRAGETIDGQPGALFEQALVQDPNSIAALWFLGLRAAESGDDRHALMFWDRLLALDIPPDVRDMVDSRRRALAGELPSL